MQPLHIETPTFESKPLNKITNKQIFLKMECYQPTGAFKIRGIGRLCQESVANGYQHLVASSGGNAGYAVAYAANKLGVRATVVVPKTTNPVFLKYLYAEGAEVIIEGEVWDEAHQAALQIVSKTKSAYIPPFDHPTIWAGHATMVDEFVTQCKKPDAIITAVGGGGLLCGILQGLEQHSWLDTAIFSVETAGAATLASTIQAGKLITLDKINTIATSLGAKSITPKLFDWTKRIKITPLIVSDAQAITACRKFADDHRVLVEPACGAALAAVYDINQYPALASAQSILVIVCGGVGISLDLLQQYLIKTQAQHSTTT